MGGNGCGVVLWSGECDERSGDGSAGAGSASACAAVLKVEFPGELGEQDGARFGKTAGDECALFGASEGASRLGARNFERLAFARQAAPHQYRGAQHGAVAHAFQIGFWSA